MQVYSESYKGKIIAITGSVGKTTFKENIYHILKITNLRHTGLLKTIIITRSTIFNYEHECQM